MPEQGRSFAVATFGRFCRGETLEGVRKRLSKPDRAEQAFGLCEAGSGFGDPAEAKAQPGRDSVARALAPPGLRSCGGSRGRQSTAGRGCVIACVEGDRAEVHLGHELVPFSTEGLAISPLCSRWLRARS